MKTWTKISLILPTIALLALTNKASLSVGDKAPLTDSQMLSTDGNKISLASASKTNGVLVVFSCNTCPFVVGNENFAGWEVQYNKINHLAQELGVGMVLVNSNEAKRNDDDSMQAMKEHAKNKSYSMPYLLDENSALANAFGAKTTPHIYLLDKDLKLIYTGSIDNSWDSKRSADIPYLENALNEMKLKIQLNTTEPRGCSIKRVK